MGAERQTNIYTLVTHTHMHTYTHIHTYTHMHIAIHKYKKKLVILQSIGIILIKSKETRVITYTCRYSSGHLIPNSS